MALELIAPAKLNLALEVTGRRPDGYHNVVTVMQTLDLADRVLIDVADSLDLVVEGDAIRNVPLEGTHNLAYAAAAALQEEVNRLDLCARVTLEKRVPAGVGLGGGSSDAAAVLRGLNRFWELDLGVERLADIAARIGSDVAFFLHGGTALATDRGEQVEPLPDIEPHDYALFLADVDLDDKTRRMYALLSPIDFTNGASAHRLADVVRNQRPVTDEDMLNVFDAHVADVTPQLAEAMTACRDAGIAVHACGSGPGFFARASLGDLTDLLLHALERDFGVHAVACKSLDRAAATAMREI